MTVVSFGVGGIQQARRNALVENGVSYFHHPKELLAISWGPNDICPSMHRSMLLQL